MRAVLDRAHLAEEAGWVQTSIATRPDEAHMFGMTLHAEDGTLTLTGRSWTGLHRAQVPAQVETPGVAVVVGASLTPLVGALAGDQVELASIHGLRNQLELASGRTRYKVAVISDDQAELHQWVPSRPDDGASTRVDPEELLAAVQRLIPFAEPWRKGSADTWTDCLLLAPDGADMLALTAGTRTHGARTLVPCERGQVGALVPARALAAALAGMGTVAELWTAGGSLYVADRPGRRAAIRLHTMDSYPAAPAEQLAHPARGVRVAVTRADLEPTLELAGVLSDRVLLRLTPQGLVVTTSDPTKGDRRGEYGDVVPGVGGGVVRLVAPTRLLQHALAALEADTVHLTATPGGRRVVLRDDAGTAVGLQTAPPVDRVT